ncbi:hypothetical protein FA13DRAFT_1729563 [Coprinellus micaceus]|uniref:Uncharacterized protein n=1 Tax=Coprinellus micaceus TaxID=71717 RepID=A0A4Y7TKM3_COPMI|nr:hypothetical protein FA13DRAFT_1729563 [Coprinellus micaceus]
MMATSTTIQLHPSRSNDSPDSECPGYISGLESEGGEGLEIISQTCIWRLAQRSSGIEA